MTVQFRPYSDFMVIVGMKASGKTTVTKFFCKSLKKFLVIDPKWQYSEVGYVVHYPERIRNALLEWKRVVYQQMTPPELKHERQKDVDEQLYRAVFSEVLKHANITLVIDEIDRFARGKWYICREFNEIVNRGRIQGIGLIGNSRMPHMFHSDIRSSADHVICFKLHEERERKYMAEWMQVNHLDIKNLAEHESLYYDVMSGNVEKQAPLY